MPATQAELEAILHGAAVAPVARGFLRITGSDASRWLNGMVTNSVQSLQPGEGNYNFLLNAQGRIQGDCTIYREPDGTEPAFVLATDMSQLAAIQEMLDRFIIMDDVELEAKDYWHDTLLILGPKAQQILRAMQHGTLEDLHADLAPLHLAYDATTAAQIATPPVAQIPQFEISTVSWNEELIKDAEAFSAVKISPQTLEAFRIYSGTPLYGTDIRNSETAKDLPQETNQTHALHFAKGCYLGQEIVERIRSRGQVHKLLTRFRLEGDLPTEFPATLTVDGKPVGELTSAALVPLPEGQQLYALGYARREFLELKKQFSYAGGTATPSPASQNVTT